MKSYNIQLITNIQQYQSLKNFFLDYTSMCNDISIILFNNYQNKNLNIKIIHDLCYKTMKTKYSNLPSQTIIKAIREIFASYKSIKSNKQQITKPIIKSNFSIRLDKRLYSNFTQNSIKISSPSSKNKRVEFKLKLFSKVKELFNDYQTKDPLLFFKNDKFYLNVTFDVPVLAYKNEKQIGIDLGIRRLVVTSEGKAFKANEFVRQKRKINYLKKELQKKNTNSSKRKLKKIKNKDRNYTKNFIHHLVNKVLETNGNTIVIEDLKGIKQKTSKTKEGFKKTKHNRRIGQIPFYLFRSILTYKALHLGKNVVTVNPYMTSQLDSRGLSNGVRKGCRYYGVDGKILDADWNAACNILQKHIKNLNSYKEPLDGGLYLMSRFYCQ